MITVNTNSSEVETVRINALDSNKRIIYKPDLPVYR